MSLGGPSRSHPCSDNHMYLVVQRCPRECDSLPKGLHERSDHEVEVGQVVAVVGVAG